MLAHYPLTILVLLPHPAHVLLAVLRELLALPGLEVLVHALLAPLVLLLQLAHATLAALHVLLALLGIQEPPHALPLESPTA